MDHKSIFRFLAQNQPVLAEHGVMNERLFPFDTASAALKLHRLAKAITQDVASRVETQA